MLVLVLLALAAALAFMTLGARGRWDFILPFRGAKLAGLVLVAYSIAVSTVLFQTVTGNRILTPSIMGFDSLYVLIQTALVFFLGAGRVSATNPQLLFVFEVAALVLFAGLLFRWLFSGSARSLHFLMLVGIIFGILFRSIASFLQRVIDPSEFLILQDRLFASFNTIDTTLLAISGAAVAMVSIMAWRMLPVFDILALGRENAIVLGVDHRRTVTFVLAMVTVLVAVSTALVGPVTFFGLLVANLAYLLLPTARHAVLLPAAALIAVVSLVGGQVILERVFAFDTALSIIIEFAGGIFFILLVVRGVAR
ncbi:iron chelate uptake ABC transporter family permease subunit [Chelativorans sp. J32]|uniref:iron chelate uptake ABC transporter family permease subunit n=1 Tax=Chelativorans sp. J32 TaxID=935840 RepID=UPI000684A1DD|nr:iron chelate uptake ABC transporter family permease subunit [Chelativorans sp. J32]